MTDTGTGTGDPRTVDPPSRWFWVLTVTAAAAFAMVVLLVVVLLGTRGRGETGRVMPPTTAAARSAVPPLDLATVAPETAKHFLYAHDHFAEYAQIPCWCGCEQFLDHRNLADCFVRADGQGWEAHAAGCGVCLGEAAIAERMLDEGRTPADVKVTVDDQYGTTAITAPAKS